MRVYVPNYLEKLKQNISKEMEILKQNFLYSKISTKDVVYLTNLFKKLPNFIIFKKDLNELENICEVQTSDELLKKLKIIKLKFIQTRE